jgi:hypothetical protein
MKGWTMKYLIIFFLVLTLVGCDEESDNNNSGGNPSTPIEQPDTPPGNPETPDGNLNWGDLRCQRRGICENPILNLDEDEILWFFESQFSVQEVNAGTEFEQKFLCGVNFQEKWTRSFPNQSQLEDEAYNVVVQFGFFMLDLETCLVQQNYVNKLNEYFIKTKEYQNEVQ